MRSSVNINEIKTALKKTLNQLSEQNPSMFEWEKDGYSAHVEHVLTDNRDVSHYPNHTVYKDRHNGNYYRRKKIYDYYTEEIKSDLFNDKIQGELAELLINFVHKPSDFTISDLYDYIIHPAIIYAESDINKKKNFFNPSHPSLKKKKINFWSGTEGQKKACSFSNEAPLQENIFFKIIYGVLYELEQSKHHDASLLHSTKAQLMYFMTLGASGVVSVYISSDKRSEHAGFTTQNFFWDVELPQLQELKRNCSVSDIQIHLYDHEKQQWKAPVSFFKSASDFIPIRSRLIHPLDDPQQSDQFKKNGMSREEKMKWQNSTARPEISLGQMRNIVRTWKDIAIFNPKSSIESYWNGLVKKWVKFEKAFKDDFDLKTKHIREKIATEHYFGEEYKGYQFTAKEFWESSHLTQEERKHYLTCFACGVTAQHMHQGNASKKAESYYTLQGIALLSKEVIQSYVKDLLDRHKIDTGHDAISQILTKFIALGQDLQKDVNERKRACGAYLFEEKINGSIVCHYIDQLKREEKEALLKIVQTLSLHPLDSKAETERHPLDHSLRHLRAKPMLGTFKDEPSYYDNSASAFTKITKYISASINASRRTTSFFDSNSSSHTNSSVYHSPKFGYGEHDDL